MEKVVWDTLKPVLRERLIEKYVPAEPVNDDLVFKLTAFYWLGQELVGNWKTGKRLTIYQKTQLLKLLVWNLSRAQQKQTAYYEDETEIMIPRIETLAEYEIRRKGLYDSGQTIPHAVDVHDVALCETSDEEEYDTGISSETAEQIAQLVLTCKELELKVS